MPGGAGARRQGPGSGGARRGALARGARAWSRWQHTCTTALDLDENALNEKFVLLRLSTAGGMRCGAQRLAGLPVGRAWVPTAQP